MCTVTLHMFQLSMATKELAREAKDAVRNPWLPQHKAERKPLRMNWVVVTDNRGQRHLVMNWNEASNDR
jgi:hypothetical protein